MRQNITKSDIYQLVEIDGEMKIRDLDLAEKLGVEVPVSNAIYEAVYTDITPEQVLSKLMNRKIKKEESYV